MSGDSKAQDSAYRQFCHLNYECVYSYNDKQPDPKFEVPENSHYLKRLEARYFFNFEGGLTRQCIRAGCDNSEGDVSNEDRVVKCIKETLVHGDTREELFFVVIVLRTRQGNEKGLEDKDLTKIKTQIECLCNTQKEDRRKKLFPLAPIP
jgi:hypothetical protein